MHEIVYFCKDKYSPYLLVCSKYFFNKYRVSTLPVAQEVKFQSLPSDQLHTPTSSCWPPIQASSPDVSVDRNILLASSPTEAKFPIFCVGVMDSQWILAACQDFLSETNL